ncbi:unnamed protein product [Cuscuta campestris]|uniref:Retrotransposon gag domain-containing protein n=1 Tax=Cuscuta campestris TaxID=132261 RepID=A0A484KAD8_9ASTE|nr:unnamed protein product [Cuscuta campestris]
MAANNQQRPRPQQSGRAPARTYAMHGRTDPSPNVILGTFILFDSVMHALIDPCSTLSYICVGMPANSAIVRSDLEMPAIVSNPLGHSMRLHHIYHRCPLSVQMKQFPADLIELPHKEFDIILGMDWLTEHRAVVDCSCRTVRLRAEDGSDVSLSGEVFPKAPEFISSLSARRLIRKKCEMFQCHVQDMRKESPRQQDIRTVCDFPDVFPEDLPGLPPPREVEFSINLIPDPTHVLPTNAVTLDESLSYEEEPVKILARETKVLRNKTVPLVKVLWPFTKEYVPTRYREERRDEFVALKQEGMSLPELRQKFDYLSQYATSLVSTPEDRLNEFVKKLRPDLRPYAALITTTDFNAAYDLFVKTEKSLDDLQATKKEDRAIKDPRPAASTGPSGKSFGFGGKRYEKGSLSAPPPKRSKSRPSPSAAASNSNRTRSHPQCVQCVH